MSWIRVSDRVTGPGAPQEVRVDRIKLRVSGMDPLQARALAQAVALGLAPTLALAPGEGSIERLAFELAAKPGEPPEQLAARAAARLAPLVGRVGALEAGR
jgi:hypothetical protein